MSKADQERELFRTIREDRSKPFELSKAPLLRATLIHRGAGEIFWR